MVPQSGWSQLRKWQECVYVCVWLSSDIQPLDEIGEKDDSGVEFNKAWEWQSLNLIIKLMH